MAEAVKARRRYHSPRRQEQAQQTRRRILQAAYDLFVERGYGGATIVAIAERAGTAAETIYAVFENKPQLLGEVVVASIRGDEDIPVIEQPGPQAILAMSDQREQVHGFAVDVAERQERGAPLVDVFVGAARSVPMLAELSASLREQRWESLGMFVDALLRNGPLRHERETAVDTVWTLADGSIYILLTEHRGWSSAQYAAWLEDTLAATLLPS
jgi:AcrR family transcriptional regulator